MRGRGRTVLRLPSRYHERPYLPRQSPISATQSILKEVAGKRTASPRRYQSALDVSRPGFLDLLHNALRHRNIIEFLCALAALLERVFEELDGFGRRRLIRRLLVHQDEGRRVD